MKQLKFQYFILIALTIIFLISCKKNDVDKPHRGNGSLTPFKVTVLERLPNRATVMWTASEDILNGDTVKYKIVLNNSDTIISNLLSLKDTITNIRPDSLYTGKVIAYTISGDTASAPFILDKISGVAIFGTDDYLQANNLFTGQLLWNTSIGGNQYGFSTPTISNDTVFISNNNSTNYSVFALSQKTGKILWKAFPYSDGYDTQLASNITYFQGKLYASARNGVICFSSVEGHIIWKYSNPNNGFTTNPVVAENMLLVGTSKGGLGSDIYALNIIDGSPLWHFTYTGNMCLRPVLINNLVIFTTDGQLVYALNKSTGKLVWSRNFVGGAGLYGRLTSPIVNNDIVIIGTSEKGYFGLNISTGETIWNYDNGLDFAGQPAIGNGLIFFSQVVGFTTYQSQISAVNVTTGKLAWSNIYPVQNIYNFIFLKNQLYVLYGYRNIKLLDPNSGNIIQTVFGGPPVDPFSIFYNDTAYYASTHGNF